MSGKVYGNAEKYMIKGSKKAFEASTQCLAHQYLSEITKIVLTS